MLLVVDVGNSSIKFGVFEGDALLFTFWCLSRELSILDLVDQIRQSMDNEGCAIHGIDTIGISSVVASNHRLISQALNEVFMARQLWLDSSYYPASLGVQFSNKDELGVDLAMGMVGAQRLLPATDIIIVDLGTVTTFVAMNASGMLKGVALLSGLRVTLRALVDSAAALPHVEVRRIYARRCMALNTVDAMLGGTYYAYVGALREIIKRMSSEMQEGNHQDGSTSMPKVVATGGYSTLLAQDVVFDVVEPNLVLYGIRDCCANARVDS